MTSIPVLETVIERETTSSVCNNKQAMEALYAKPDYTDADAAKG